MTRSNVDYFDPAPILALQRDQTNAAFARRVGVTRETVSRWHRGRHLLYRSTAEQVAMALDRHPLDLWPDIAILDEEWRERAFCKNTEGRYHLAQSPDVDEARRLGVRETRRRQDAVAKLKRKANEMCGTCPVRLSCLDWVLRNIGDAQDVGIWAGTTRNQRKRMRHALKVKVA